MNLMSAMGGISDRHIVEFARVSPKRGRITLGLKLASAACLAVIAAGVPMIREVIYNSVPGSSDSGSFSESADYSFPPNSLTPCVIVNGVEYIIDPYGSYEMELSEDYEIIGQVLTVDPANDGKEGFSAGCEVGEVIYQNPDFPGEVYVYTKLFTGGKTYRFLRFVDREMYNRDLAAASVCRKTPVVREVVCFES